MDFIKKSSDGKLINVKDSRLFTFGCSHTQHYWPSWSDYIGFFFKEYYNYGRPGCGQNYILSHIYEVNELYNLTKDDTVLIMLSDINRADYVKPDTTWTARGNMYAENNLDIYGEKFILDIWSPFEGLRNTWIAVKSIKHFLDSVGCKYKIFKAFKDLDDQDIEMYAHWDKDNFNKNIVRGFDFGEAYRRINRFTTGEALYEYENKEVERYQFWVKDGDDPPRLHTDGHLRVEEHLEWIKREAREFYDEYMEDLCNQWRKITEDKYMEPKDFDFLLKPTHQSSLVFGKEAMRHNYG